MGVFLRSIVLTPIFVALAAVIFGYIEQSQYVSLPKPNSLGPIRDRPPTNSKEFGRYTKALNSIDYSWVESSKWFNFRSLKHWDYKSISTPRYFIVAAIANFNYIANAFVYVVDRTDREKPFYQYAARSALAQTIEEQATSSVHGCTNFTQSSTEFIHLCYNQKEKKYVVEANVPVRNNLQISLNCQIDFSNDKDQSMALIYPVDVDRPAYTHKVAGLRSQGTIKIGNAKEETFRDGLSSIDWTLAYSERISHWKWVSLSTVATNSSNKESLTIGINLSDYVYDDKNGISMEAAVWIAGKVYTFGKVIYKLPEEQYQTSRVWEIYTVEESSADTPKLQLKFQPWGSQEEHINVGFLAGDFVQVFGVYQGQIELLGHTYVIENGFGVTENHYAKW